jgi:hypothetical protein
MTKPTKDGFSTAALLDLLSGMDDTEQRTFSALDCLNQKYHDPRAELLESYDVTEDDVRKYYSEWEKLRNS